MFQQEWADSWSILNQQTTVIDPLWVNTHWSISRKMCFELSWVSVGKPATNQDVWLWIWSRFWLTGTHNLCPMNQWSEWWSLHLKQFLDLIDNPIVLFNSSHSVYRMIYWSDIKNPSQGKYQHRSKQTSLHFGRQGTAINLFKKIGQVSSNTQSLTPCNRWDTGGRAWSLLNPEHTQSTDLVRVRCMVSAEGHLSITDPSPDLPPLVFLLHCLPLYSLLVSSMHWCSRVLLVVFSWD